jgi:hypothetical protein
MFALQTLEEVSLEVMQKIEYDAPRLFGYYNPHRLHDYDKTKPLHLYDLDLSLKLSLYPSLY